MREAALMRDRDQSLRPARRQLRAVGVLLVAIVAAGCGQDNPGEPRTPAADLVMPSPRTVDGTVHVYCVESQETHGVTPCGVSIDLSNAAPSAVLGAWWL